MQRKSQIKAIVAEINKVVKGKESVINKILMAMLANGHILIEDIPGVGKTTIAIAFSKVLQLSYKRIQFTPDVLPSDILGFYILNKKGELEFREGAIACNIFLADEINRTSAKTQSALLEVMEEGSITVDGITKKLPEPFHVIATQNPVGSIGTQLLPESQLDRFMIKISVGYPDIQQEIEILKCSLNQEKMQQIHPVVEKKDWIELQKEVEKVYISDLLYEYIVNIVEKTRTNQWISLGVSPRGTIAITKMAQAHAYINNREFLIPEDVTEIINEVISHRIILNTEANIRGVTVSQIVQEIIHEVEVPTIC